MTTEPSTSIALDPDLAALTPDRKRQIATARMDNLSVQLYELLLNRQHLIDVEGPADQVEGMTKQGAKLRRAIALHRNELESLEPEED